MNSRTAAALQASSALSLCLAAALAGSPLRAAEPAPAGLDDDNWQRIQAQVEAHVDAGIAAGSGTVKARGGASGPPLVRTAVISADFSNMPAQTTPGGPEFGYSVALDGDWLAVGAPGAIAETTIAGIGPYGVVFLFRRVGNQWQQDPTTVIIPSGGAPRCGHSIALKLPHLVVGCPAAELSGNPGSATGRFYLLRLNESGPPYSPIAGAFGSDGSECGTAVDVSPVSAGGSAVMVVGCAGASNGRGLVRVYRIENGNLTAHPSIMAADGTSGDRFGESLALFRSTGPVVVQRLAVGAPAKAFSPAFGAGSAYVFEGPNWTQTANFTHVLPNSFSLTQFGSAVAMNSTQLVIGARGGWTTTCANVPRCGTVRRYERSGGTWQPAEGGGAINASGNPAGEQPGMQFGAAVAIGFDNWVAVAAPRTDGWNQFNGLAESAGMVELRRDDDGSYGVSWNDSQGELSPSPVGALAFTDGRFGTSLDFGNRMLAVGYPRSGSQFTGRRGQVWIYETDVIFADDFED